MEKETLEELIKRVNEMEKKLKIHEDIELIKQLHIRYVNAHTFGNSQDELDCYTDDCIFNIGMEPLKGKKAIAEFMKQTELPESADPIPDGAFVVHPLITVDGNKAKGNWLHYDMHSHPRTYQSLFWIQGIYDCEYVRVNGQWKISLMKWRDRIHPPGKPPWDAPLAPIHTGSQQ